MLYIEPVFKIGPTIARRGRFGYADDICQLVVSKSLEENTTRLQNITTDLMAWGRREGLTFDLAKTESSSILPEVGRRTTPPALSKRPRAQWRLNLPHPMRPHAGWESGLTGNSNSEYIPSHWQPRQNWLLMAYKPWPTLYEESELPYCGKRQLPVWSQSYARTAQTKAEHFR